MIKSHNELFYKTLAAVFAIFILWFSAAALDYSFVFRKGKTPVFCFLRSVNSEVDIYNGIGYSYTFITENGKIRSIDFENFFGANVYLVNCE